MVFSLVLSLFILLATVLFFRHPQRCPLVSSPIPNHTFLPTTIETKELPQYPWNHGTHKKVSPITKEYFRCKGSSLNPPIPILRDGKVVENIFDCNGPSSHSLPIRHGQEFIYPILIELLNEIQATTGKPVTITSGHCCPAHNKYIDPSPKNQASKHQTGAEVSFYVPGLEGKPEVILSCIEAFYKSQPRYAADKAYAQFERYDKETDVSTKPWFNKEILFKLYLPHEGRNGDNKHGFAYFSLQVRFDRDTNMRVGYSWDEALQYHRK